MLADVNFENMSPFEAACKWITENEEYINSMVPQGFSNFPRKTGFFFSFLSFFKTVTLLTYLSD